MKRGIIVLLLSLALVLAGCTAGPNPVLGTGSADGDPAGFWLGLWHGFILAFSFVVSLFHDGVFVYETQNAGHLYDLGFVLGVMFFFGGSGGASKCGRR